MSSLPLVWVLRDQLALGPAPRLGCHWQQLRSDGFRSVVSLCESGEGCEALPADSLIPLGWSARPLPDVRTRRQLDPGALAAAVDHTLQLVQEAAPVYVHCRAGLERSPLVVLGVLCLALEWDIFQALAYLRRLHPAAQPTLQQLAVLEQWLASGRGAGQEVACA